MDRDVKILLGLTEKLDRELEISQDLFFLERPFLEETTDKPVFVKSDELDEKKRQNEENIRLLVKEIRERCKPKPINAVQDMLFDH